MTILERRQRWLAKKDPTRKRKFQLLRRHCSPPPPKRASGIAILSPLHRLASLRSLLPLTSRNLHMEPPCPDVFVWAAMRAAVRGMLRDPSAGVSLFQMAEGLAGDDRIFDLYSAAGGGGADGRGKAPPPGTFRGGGGPMEALVSGLRDKVSLYASESIDKHERERRLHRKYQLTNAFSKLRNTTGSTTKIFIRSWEDALPYLEGVMDTSALPLDFRDDQIDEDRRWDVQKYLKELQRISISSVAEAPIGLTPAQLRLQAIANTKYVPNTIPKALQEEIEAEYQRREDKEKERLAKLREIEDQQKAKEQEEEARKRADELIRSLTEEEQALVKTALYGAGPPAEVLAKVGTDSCQRSSIQRLQPGEWLNDEVIHYFLIMLGLRDEQLVKEGKKTRRSHFFKSYFMTKLLNDGDAEKDGLYEYRNVKRWSKHVPGKDIFELDKIFFPVNVGRTHWVVVVSFMQQKKIQFFDSFGDAGTHWMEAVFRYIKDEHNDKKKCPLPDAEQWELVPCVRGTPRQLNGYDCGVFTCMFCDFVSKDCPLVFNQNHITQCRERICLSILSGRAIL